MHQIRLQPGPCAAPESAAVGSRLYLYTFDEVSSHGPRKKTRPRPGNLELLALQIPTDADQ